MVEEDGSALEAFEPRGSRELRRQGDGQDEGGKEEQDEGGKEGQDEGGKMMIMMKMMRNVLGMERSSGGSLKRTSNKMEMAGVGQLMFGRVMKMRKEERWVKVVTKVDNGWNLEDCFRRFKQRQGEQQQQSGRDESREKDGGCEQRQEMDQDERERLRGGIGQGKGMRKGQGKGKGEVDEQKDWEERWRVKKENWMNEQWGRMSEDDWCMGQTGEIETRTGSGCEIEE